MCVWNYFLASLMRKVEIFSRFFFLFLGQRNQNRTPAFSSQPRFGIRKSGRKWIGWMLLSLKRENCFFFVKSKVLHPALTKELQLFENMILSLEFFVFFFEMQLDWIWDSKVCEINFWLFQSHELLEVISPTYDYKKYYIFRRISCFEL